MPEGPNELTHIENEELHFIKENLRFKRNFTYYSNLVIYVLPAFFIVAGLMVFYFGRIQHSNDTHIGNFLPMIIITLGVSLAAFFHKRIQESERFEMIPIIKFDFPVIENQLKSKFKINNIAFNESDEVLTVQTKMHLLSRGEKLTIIKHNQHLLINSRSLSSKQPVMLFKNRKNMDQLKAIIKETCDDNLFSHNHNSMQ